MSHPIVVNIEALNELAFRLGTIYSGLENVPAHPYVDPSACGDPGVADEFESFLAHWSQGRARIETEVQAIGKIVQFAASTYSQADDVVAAAAKGGGGG